MEVAHNPAARCGRAWCAIPMRTVRSERRALSGAHTETCWPRAGRDTHLGRFAEEQAPALRDPRRRTEALAALRWACSDAESARSGSGARRSTRSTVVCSREPRELAHERCDSLGCARQLDVSPTARSSSCERVPHDSGESVARATARRGDKTNARRVHIGARSSCAKRLARAVRVRLERRARGCSNSALSSGGPTPSKLPRERDRSSGTRLWGAHWPAPQAVLRPRRESGCGRRGHARPSDGDAAACP